MIPVKLVVIEHFQEVFVREDATGETEIVTASEPRRLIEGCYAGPSRLALLTTHRFSDHTPYYRGEDILSRMGFRIHHSTQCRWMQRLAVAVGPLVELMQQRMIRSHVLQMDETVIPIVDHDLGRTRNGYFWLAYGDSCYPYDCFWFTPTRGPRGDRRATDSRCEFNC